MTENKERKAASTMNTIPSLSPNVKASFRRLTSGSLPSLEAMLTIEDVDDQEQDGSVLGY